MNKRLACLLVGILSATGLAAAPSLEEPPVACSPERAAVVPREVIHVAVWMPGETWRYAWSVNGGRVVGEGADVTWDFAGVEPGTYTATVRASRPGNTPATCSMQVIVMDPGDSRGVPRLSGRSLLDAQETAGYGLYSYILFADAPDDTSRDRYKKAIEAYVSLMPDVLALERYLKPGELAITYAPVDAPPPRSVSSDWILEHYNYAHAQVLLRLIPDTHHGGPYLLSALTPLTGKAAVPGVYLFQNLSTVPPHLVSAWMKLFLNQTSQERFWEPQTTALLGLRLRTAIGVMALGLPDVQKSLQSWISWTH